MRVHGLLWGVLGSLALGAVGCRIYADDGNPVPSSDWSWQCADGAPAPDAGCPLDGGTDDGGGGDDDAASRR